MCKEYMYVHYLPPPSIPFKEKTQHFFISITIWDQMPFVLESQQISKINIFKIYYPSQCT